MRRAISFQDAVLTKPYHPDGVAADLDTALRRSREDRLARHAALRTTAWQDTASAWTRALLDELRS